jgi:hypothetical protein
MLLIRMIMEMDMLDIVTIRRLRNMDIPMNIWSMLVSLSWLQQTVISLGQALSARSNGVKKS